MSVSVWSSESGAISDFKHGWKHECVVTPGSDVAMCSNELGPVVQSTVSLTSSLRGQLVKCFTTV